LGLIRTFGDSPNKELREEPRPMELIQELIDDGDREDVLDGDSIEGTIVDAEALRSISLLDEQD